MNYDLIIKLAKLANNNPNENEANLAARKVCKLLEESKFVFTVWPLPKQQSQGTWSGFNKPPESTKYQRPPDEPQPQYTRSPFEDFFKNYYKEQRYYYQRPPKEYTVPKDSYKYTDFNTSNEKRSIKCKTCGHVKETRFRGPADLWECMECRGNTYNKNQK